MKSSRSADQSSRRVPKAMCGQPKSGSTLLEALVALTILGVALLMLAAFVGLHAKTARKLADHRRVADFVEARYEELRAGGVVGCETKTTELDVEELAVADAFSLTVDVEELQIENLCRVELRARFHSAGLPAQLVVETMIWRPE